MKKLAILSMVLCASVAGADPVVLRAHANEYALVGEGKVLTKDCTVTAEGTLQGKLVRRGHKSWLVFLDRDGEEEGQCEVRWTLSVPHRRTMVAHK